MGAAGAPAMTPTDQMAGALPPASETAEESGGYREPLSFRPEDSRSKSLLLTGSTICIYFSCLFCRLFLGDDVVRRPFEAEAHPIFSYIIELPSRRWAMAPGEQAGMQARLDAGTGGLRVITSYH